MRCKKWGCGRAIPIAFKPQHGQQIRCAKCKTPMKYCGECHMFLVNFRRHRKQGHVLYEVQRDKDLYNACKILLSLCNITTQ